MLGAITSVANGGTVFLLDGIYTVSEPFATGDGITLQNYNNSKPILTAQDNTPPIVQIGNSCTVDGIWFGGTRDINANGGQVFVGDGCTVKNCTLFGYYGGIVEGQHINNTYEFNRFVNCGGDGLYHDIYISYDSSAKIYDNIFLGGEGYKIHLWHDEANIDVQRNFCGGTPGTNGGWLLVMHHVTDLTKDCIFWNHICLAGVFVTVNISKGQFLHNLFGHKTFGTGKWDQDMNGTTDLTVDGLGLIGDRYLDTITWPGYSVNVGPYNGDGHTLPAPGTNYTHYAVTDLSTLLGYSEAQIDAAVASLVTSFGQSIQTIHDDNTVEGNFTILRNCVNSWKVA